MVSEPDERLRLALTTTDEFREHLSKVLAVPPDVLLQLVRSSRREGGFDGTVDEGRVAIWLRHSSSTSGLVEVLSLLSFLFNRVVERKIDPDAAADELVRYAESIGLAGAPERRSILREAFEASTEFQKKALATPFLRHGLPNLKSSSATVQLRGVFESKESDNPNALVPVLQIRIVAEYDDDEEDEQSFLFQCGANELDTLIELLSLYRRRLGRLVASASGLEVLKLTDPTSKEGASR